LDHGAAEDAAVLEEDLVPRGELRHLLDRGLLVAAVLRFGALTLSGRSLIAGNRGQGLLVAFGRAARGLARHRAIAAAVDKGRDEVREVGVLTRLLDRLDRGDAAAEDLHSAAFRKREPKHAVVRARNAPAEIDAAAESIGALLQADDDQVTCRRRNDRGLARVGEGVAVVLDDLAYLRGRHAHPALLAEVDAHDAILDRGPAVDLVAVLENDRVRECARDSEPKRDGGPNKQVESRPRKRDRRGWKCDASHGELLRCRRNRGEGSGRSARPGRGS